MAGLGSLYIDLVARTGKFETDTGRAARLAERRAREIQRSFDRMTSGINRAFASVGVGLSVAAVGRFISDTLEMGDQLAKAAQSAGVTGEAISELSYAAKLSG